MLIVRYRIKTQTFINNNRENNDNREEDKSRESNIGKKFDTILTDIKNDRKSTKSIRVKSLGNNISVHPLIIKVLNTERRCSKKIMGLTKHLFFG